MKAIGRGDGVRINLKRKATELRELQEETQGEDSLIHLQTHEPNEPRNTENEVQRVHDDFQVDSALLLLLFPLPLCVVVEGICAGSEEEGVSDPHPNPIDVLSCSGGESLVGHSNDTLRTLLCVMKQSYEQEYVCNLRKVHRYLVDART